MKDDLISRKVALEYLDKRRTYELMAGRNKAYGKGIRDAMKDIENQPSVLAVPLDALCDYLSKSNEEIPFCPDDKADCIECKLRGVACLRKRIIMWMEENANDAE